MDNSVHIFLSMIFGSFGMGYFVYGKKQSRGMAFVAGAGLMIIPYLMPSVLLLIIAGIALMALPFIIKY